MKQLSTRYIGQIKKVRTYTRCITVLVLTKPNMSNVINYTSNFYNKTRGL